jgi:CO/xanthine dehydrogenase Mo-binding subunit
MSSDNIPNGKPPYRVIGTRPIRHDGADKVTGRAKYGADYACPGMLHGKVLRSPRAHAKIKSINGDAARALPGSSRSSPALTFPRSATRARTSAKVRSTQNTFR